MKAAYTRVKIFFTQLRDNRWMLDKCFKMSTLQGVSRLEEVASETSREV